MLIGPDGSVASVHYVPPSSPPPPAANDVSTAKAALQQQFGNNAPDNGAALAAAIQKIQQENATLTEEALARAAILLQGQYNAAHHQAQDANVDPIKEAESQVGLTHQFDQSTLDAAAKSLSDSPLATAPANTSNAAPTVSLADARTAIQTGLNNGLTWQEAVNAARVRFGGLAQNETVLDEAALTVEGDQLATGADASHGDVLDAASQQLAGLRLFGDENNREALAALKVTLTPSPALSVDAKRADATWVSLQQDLAAHADATQIATDWRAYHTALSAELDDAGNRPPTSTVGSASWAADASQSDRRWLAERAVIAANTAAGMRAPTASDLFTALHASEKLDAMEAAPASLGANSSAAANLKAAQVLTQQLAGMDPNSALYQQVMDDPRTLVLKNAAFGDISGAHGGDARATLNAEGAALSGYRNTVLFPALLHDTLASSTTQQNLQAVGSPDNLRDIPNLLDPLAQASPEFAQALFTQLQGKIEALIQTGPEVIEGTDSSQIGDSYYGPLARIIDDAGGPKSTTTKPVVDALRTKLDKQQAQVDEGGTEALSNPFQPLTYLHDARNSDPTTVYQALIDEAPTSELAKTLEQYTGLKPHSAPATVTVSSPSDASALAQAQAALEKQLGNGPVNAQTLQKALAAAQAVKDKNENLANTNISDTTWAQAALVEQAQADGRANASSNTAAPKDMVAQASSELSGDQLFDANTIDAATRGLQGGTLVDGSSTSGSVSVQEDIPAASQPSAAEYMQSLVSEGMTMSEAIVLTRAWLGGTSASEPALVQAALTVRAEQQDIMQAYYNDPTQDPIKLAAQQLETLNKTLGGNANDPVNLLDPTLIEQTVGTQAAPGMAQDVKPDLNALNGTNGQLGLIAQVQSAYSTWQSAYAKAKANPSDSGAQSANTAALAKYQSALSAALNAAAGRKAGDDTSWLADPMNVDTVWKAEYELDLNALAPEIVAAQGTAQDSPQNQALQAAFEQWQDGFNALQAISTAQAAQQRAAAAAHGDASAGNVAAAQSLTFQLGGLARTDPLYVQVMDTAWASGVEKAALTTITAAGAPPMVCTANGAELTNAKARFHAEAALLQQYQPTIIYAQLTDDVVSDPTTQQLFSTIEGEVRSQKSDADKLKTLADVVGGSGSTDLSARLVHQMFGTGAKSTFSPAQLVAWTQDANDLTQVSRIYAAAAGAQNQDMTDLRHALETMVTSGDPSFGGESGSSQFNKHLAPMGRVVVQRGEDLGFGTLKSNYVQSQLAQDMLDDNATDPLGKEITRETGFKDAGKPAAGVSVSAPGKSALSSDAAYVPGTGVSVSTGGSLVGLQLPDGMRTFSSDDALLNAVGSANDLQVAYTPTTLEQEQALSDGTFALYDPNETVFDASGHKTTLGQVVKSLMQGEGVSTPSALAPVTMAALSGEWWNTRTPSQDQQGTTFTLLEGISASGNLINVGPADPTVRQGYADWQSHTGFAKGFMTVQPHWVVNAQGVDLTDAASFTDYKPDMSWLERWGSDLQIAGMVAAGILALAAPETAPLWLALASGGADAYFAVTAAVGTVDAAKKLSTAQGRGHWVNWLNLAANMFGGAASGVGAFARAATIGDRLAAGSSAYADVAGVTSVARGMDAQNFAQALMRATLNGTRLTRTFDDTLAARLLARPALLTDGTMRGTAAFAGTMQACQDAALFKLLGGAAMLTNGASLAHQAVALVQAGLEGKPVTAQDWLNLASSAGLMGLGFGVARVNSINEIDDQPQQQARNQPADPSITPHYNSAGFAGEDPAPDARQRTAAPPMRSYTIPDETQANPLALATVMSIVLSSHGHIERATYVVFASRNYDPAQRGLSSTSASQAERLHDDIILARDDELKPTRYGSMDAARMVATASHGIAIVDSGAVSENGEVPPEAVIATIRPGQSGLRSIGVNPDYAQPIGFAYPLQGRASTQPSIEIDEATGGWLVPDEVRQNGGMMDELISRLLDSGGRLAGTRYAVYGAKAHIDPAHALDDHAAEVEYFDDLDALARATDTSQQEESNGGQNGADKDQANRTVAIVDDSGRVVATLRRDPVANGWQANFVRDYEGSVSVAYPDGFEAGKPLIRSESIDAINAPTADGRTKLASYPRREADLAIYSVVPIYPENRLLGNDESGNPHALLMPAPPGYFVVNQHAGPTGFIYSAEEHLTPEDEAALIIGAGWDGKTPILFYVCGPGVQFRVGKDGKVGEEGDDEQILAPLVIQKVTDALQLLYPLMRGEPVDAGFHTVAANSPVAWYVPDDDARVGGYTVDVRVASKQDWNDAPELASWRVQQDSIVGAKHLRFSRFYPSLPIIG
jgi:hypothetical protein